MDRAILQRFVTAGITQSAVRLGRTHKGVTGMRRAAREFCVSIDLDTLPSPDGYPVKLDGWTDDLRRKFPAGGQYWGVARKCLNIFLRDACYSAHLRETCERLRLLEPFLEVPLDSYVANGLLSEDGAAKFGLQRWRSIVGLTPPDNDIFQRWASEVSNRKSVHRVHLDLLYFPFP